MTNPTKLAIVGAGGLAREVAGLLEARVARREIELLGFVEAPGGPHLGRVLHGLPCHELDHYRSAHPDFSAVVAIGAPAVREKVFRQLDGLGVALLACIHDGAMLSRSVRVGAGSVIFGGVSMTADIELGRGVIVNPGCTVGHDTVIEDFATISPGAHIAGAVLVRRGAFVGIGASVSNGTQDRPLVIGEYATVGAGACVIRDVPARATVAGVPAAEI